MNVETSNWKIIGKQGDTRYLIDCNHDSQGRILDLDANILYAEFYIPSILARGYWDDYTGDENIDDLIEGVVIQPNREV